MTDCGGVGSTSVEGHEANNRSSSRRELPPQNYAPSVSTISYAENGDGRGEKYSVDRTNRNLKSRHIQLIGIGGTIGTALYVSIGGGLLHGGPASLFIAFTFWCTVILCITTSMAEMVTYLPISSPFITFAGRYVDSAFGVAAGYNFFIFEAALIPFEVVACNIIIQYWTSKIHVGIIIAVILVMYAFANFFAVAWYGESEFWMALGKVLLIIGLIAFTFVTMVGGNPEKDAYGFRYWNDPGPFAEYIKPGKLGKFLGFLACLIQASFTIAGPDYVSMAAGEAINPRVVMPKAYNAVFYRLTCFFVLGSLCVGIVVPSNDPTLADALSTGKPGAAASPYVIAMDRLNIRILPHIVNAAVLTAAFSAGNSYVYCASRSLYGLALEGKAPKMFLKCTKTGVPVYCVASALAIGLLSYLQVSNSAAVVLSWLVSLVTASQLISYSVISFTFIAWRRALKAQNIPLSSLPYKSITGVRGAYYAFTATTVMCLVNGYTVFLPGWWNVPNFLFSYLMVAICPVIFVVWKLVKKTKVVDPSKADILTGKAEIDEYERHYIERPPR
ncbi:amino acid transporter-like protein [Peziza echinospora]|nr:amino acid transporter-like protein [Peziza echinospora]